MHAYFITEERLPFHSYNHNIPLTPCPFKETETYTKFTKATPVAHASDDVIVKWLPLINAHAVYTTNAPMSQQQASNLC